MIRKKRSSSSFLKMEACKLCPHECGVDRTAGQTGFCGAGALPEIFRAGSHYGEEPPVSGTSGSGTVFFSRCTLKCIYCQNYPWSQGGEGDIYTVDKLAEVFAGLADEGCHNWNLVSPTPWLPMIRDAVGIVRDGGRNLPIVYNSSGFEKNETLVEYADVADIYLLDLRYARAESASEGSGCADYPQIARRALAKAWDLAGPLKMDKEGIACSGVICRILVLPGKADEAVENLRWLAETFGAGMSVSVMSQYTPAFKAVSGDWARKVLAEEYRLVMDTAEELEFDNGWVQGFEEPAPAGLIGFNMSKGIA